MAGIRSRGMGGGAWQDHPEIKLDKPLNIICHQGDIQVEIEDAIKLDYDITRYHGHRVINIDPVAKAWIEYILGYQIERDLLPKDRPDALAHVIGFVDLPIKLMQKAGHGLPIYLKEPETSLHPSQQSKIADFAIAMTNNLDNETGSFTSLPDNYTDGWSSEG